ncbi:MAG TPA: hypothetical protein VD757_01805 [Candidatus Nitrosocosmicus sp.]|nr:hypothetical protein [Candidatus Nitrosocosmicus sp.]
MQYRGYVNKIVDMYFSGIPALEAIAAVGDLIKNIEKRNERIKAMKTGQAKEQEFRYYMREATLRAQKHHINMSKFGGR